MQCTATIEHDLQRTRKLKKKEKMSVFHLDLGRVQGLLSYILGELQIFEHKRLCQMSVERVELTSPRSNARVFN